MYDFKLQSEMWYYVYYRTTSKNKSWNDFFNTLQEFQVELIGQEQITLRRYFFEDQGEILKFLCDLVPKFIE